MKSIKNIVVIAILICLFNSCKKKDSTPDKGDIRVSVHYVPNSNSSYVYYLYNDIKIVLSKDNNELATQYLSGTGTLDFGEYEYGNYYVRVTATEFRTSVSSGSSSFYRDYDLLNNLTVGSTTNSTTFELTHLFFQHLIRLNM